MSAAPCVCRDTLRALSSTEHKWHSNPGRVRGNPHAPCQVCPRDGVVAILCTFNLDAVCCTCLRPACAVRAV
eukprot:364868-Chlamydomonas_euryale.AAC.16